LLDFFPSPGLLSERILIDLANDVTKGTPRPEDDEKITARVIPLLTAMQWIKRCKICDAKSVAGILYYARFIARKR
jgi:hypothetical protein